MDVLIVRLLATLLSVVAGVAFGLWSRTLGLNAFQSATIWVLSFAAAVGVCLAIWVTSRSRQRG